MSKPEHATARDALIHDLLGDLGKVEQLIRSLPESFSSSTKAAEESTNNLIKATDNLIAKVDAKVANRLEGAGTQIAQDQRTASQNITKEAELIMKKISSAAEEAYKKFDILAEERNRRAAKEFGEQLKRELEENFTKPFNRVIADHNPDRYSRIANTVLSGIVSAILVSVFIKSSNILDYGSPEACPKVTESKATTDKDKQTRK